MTTTPTDQAAMLQSIGDRAQRQLDGMTINRDAFARDVLRLVAAVQQAQARAPVKPQPGGFADTFGELFADIFKTHPKGTP